MLYFFAVKDIFDAKYYTDSNEDLKEAFGYDWDAYLNHYLTYGALEGRDNGTESDENE